ncbi:MAG: nucleoside triphosphate pyrophosphohydrolase [Candidatus Nomurabacteria bacterium]|nr:MAG: nucleoside triphosphate pyrophosphohydrolase [Candidatus Nomurabacteria bacterium]
MSEITRIYYNKLVRDNIPDMIRAKRHECETTQITDVQEFQQELFKKIKEEAASLSMARTKEEFLTEYADLMMVLNTIMQQLEITADDVKKAKEKNYLKKGAYKHRQFLKWSADVSYESNESPQGIPL